jgi:hypothetical protein
MASAWRNIQDDEEDEDDDFKPEVQYKQAAQDLTFHFFLVRGVPSLPHPTPSHFHVLTPHNRRRHHLRAYVQQADREALVFLIDASPEMLQLAPRAVVDANHNNNGNPSEAKTYLDVAVDCAQSVLRSRIMSAPSDQQGVVFFGAREVGLYKLTLCSRP